MSPRRFDEAAYLTTLAGRVSECSLLKQTCLMWHEVITAVTPHHICHVLLEPSDRSLPHSGEEITQMCEHQEVESLSYFMVSLPQSLSLICKVGIKITYFTGCLCGFKMRCLANSALWASPLAKRFHLKNRELTYQSQHIKSLSHFTRHPQWKSPLCCPELDPGWSVQHECEWPLTVSGECSGR